MGTIRKYARKIKLWFNRKAKAHLKEAKDAIREIFSDMEVEIEDLFDDEARGDIADELMKRLLEAKDWLSAWIIELAMETLWDEVQKGFSSGRSR